MPIRTLSLACLMSLCLLTFPSPVQAHELDEWVLRAAEANPGLQAAWNRWQAALEGIPQAGALPEPKLTLGLFLREVETRVGPQRGRLSLMQNRPPRSRRRWQRELAKRQADVLEAKFRSMRLELESRVKTAWYEYVLLGRKLEILRQMRDLLKEFEPSLVMAYSAGQAGHPEVVRLQLERGRIEDRLGEMERRGAPLRARLNRLANRPVTGTIEFPRHFKDPSFHADEAELLALAAERSPDLAALDRELDRQTATVRLARLAGRQDVTYGIDFVETDSARMPGTMDSGKDPVMVSATWSLPVRHEVYRAKRGEAEGNATAAMLARQDAGIERDAEIVLALSAWRDAKRRISLYQSTLIPKARESMQVVQQAFVTGQSGFADLVTAERLLLEFQLAEAGARFERAKATAELERLTGGPLPSSDRK